MTPMLWTRKKKAMFSHDKRYFTSYMKKIVSPINISAVKPI